MANTKISEATNIDSMRIQEQSAVGDSPPSGYGKIVALDDGTLHYVASDDTDTELGSGGGSFDLAAIHDNVASEISAIAEKVSPVSADLILIEDSADSNAKKKVQIGNLPSNGGRSIAILSEGKADGTNGGSSFATTWNTRDLNTVKYDPDNIVSISSSKFTPVAGTYKLRATATGYQVGSQTLRLYNVTASSEVDTGFASVAGVSDSSSVLAEIITTFVANGTDEYRIDHYTQFAVVTFGLGISVSGLTNTEIYCYVDMEKIG